MSGKAKEKRAVRGTGIPEKYDGVIWTAIRAMMSETRESDTARNMDCVRRIAGLMSEAERRRTASDIRRNIEWNEPLYDLAVWDVAGGWAALSRWLDSGRSHEATERIPTKSISDTWQRVIMHSIRYVMHRHTYASSYIEDIAMLTPLMSEPQLREISDYVTVEASADDDEGVRKFAAFMDRNNRHLVHSVCTAEQMSRWVKDNNCVTYPGYEAKGHDETVACFLFEGRYFPVESYIKRPYARTTMIDDFIVSVSIQGSAVSGSEVATSNNKTQQS